MIEQYAIYFEGNTDKYGYIKGYYAAKQPNYEWSFTDDINEAKLWKSKTFANKHIKQQKMCSYRDLSSRLDTVEVETVETRVLVK